MSGKLGYLNIISWTLLFLMITCIVFATKLLSKLSNSQDNDVLYHSRDSEVTFGALTVITIIGTAILALWALPATPLVFPYTQSNLLSDKDSIASSVATEIDPNLLVADHKWFPVQDVQIEQDNTNCAPECTVLEYAVRLQISNAKLQLGEQTNLKQLNVVKDGFAENNEKVY